MSDATIPQLLAQVEQASAELVEARARESAARSEATTCLNALNEAQKKLDAAIAEAKKAAPRDSEWDRQQNPIKGFGAG